MIFSSHKKVALESIISPPPGRNYYTNNDIINGSISLRSENKIQLKSLKVVFYGLCTSTVPDVMGTSTYNVAERHYCVKIEKLIIPPDPNLGPKEEQTLLGGNHLFHFNINIPSYDYKLACDGHCDFIKSGKEEIGMPPTFNFDGQQANVNIQYGIRVFLERKDSKNSRVDSNSIKFIPSSLFTAFNIPHCIDLPESSREAKLNYNFKLDASSVSTNNSSTNLINAANSQSSFNFVQPGSNTNSYYSKTSSIISNDSIPPNMLSPITEQNNLSRSKFPRMNRNPKFFDQTFNKFRITPPPSQQNSPTDSLFRVDSFQSSNSSSASFANSDNSENNNTNNKLSMKSLLGLKTTIDFEFPITMTIGFEQNVYKDFDERGILKHKSNLANHMNIIFVTEIDPHIAYHHISSNMINSAKEFNLKLTLTNLNLKLVKFTKVKTLKSQSQEINEIEILNLKKPMIEVDLLRFQTGYNNGKPIYEGKLPNNALDCVIESDCPSFQFCNAEREHQLKISGEFQIPGSQSSQRFNLVTDVAILA